MGQSVIGAAEAIHSKALELGTTNTLITAAEAMLQDEGLILEREPSQLTSLLWGEMPCGEMPISCGERGHVGRCRSAVGREPLWGDAGGTSDEMPASTARELSSSDQPGISFSFEAPEPKNRTSCPKKDVRG